MVNYACAKKSPRFHQTSVFAPLTTVMGHETAQMAVMRLDVVVSSY